MTATMTLNRQPHDNEIYSCGFRGAYLLPCDLLRTNKNESSGERCVSHHVSLITFLAKLLIPSFVEKKSVDRFPGTQTGHSFPGFQVTSHEISYDENEEPMVVPLQRISETNFLRCERNTSGEFLV